MFLVHSFANKILTQFAFLILILFVIQQMPFEFEIQIAFQFLWRIVMLFVFCKDSARSKAESSTLLRKRNYHKKKIKSQNYMAIKNIVSVYANANCSNEIAISFLQFKSNHFMVGDAVFYTEHISSQNYAMVLCR